MKSPKAQPADSAWRAEGRIVRYEGDHLSVVEEVVSTPTRPGGTHWTTVHRKQAVVIAAMTRDGKFLLLREERIPIRQTTWGMPAGQVDAQNPTREMIEEAARRELLEETGYRIAAGGELIPLGDFFASPGFTDEREFLFLARPVEHAPEAKRHDTDSIVECRALSPAELRDMIANDQIRDANTLACFARLTAKGLVSFSSKDR